MKIFFINNAGAGFADNIDIQEGTSIGQLFEQRMTQQKPTDFLIRCNRQVCPADQVLQEGDRVSMTPLKIEGAYC